MLLAAVEALAGPGATRSITPPSGMTRAIVRRKGVSEFPYVSVLPLSAKEDVCRTGEGGYLQDRRKGVSEFPYVSVLPLSAKEDVCRTGEGGYLQDRRRRISAGQAKGSVCRRR